MMMLRSSIAAALLCASALAWAEPSPYYLGLAQSFSHDNNVYRLNDSTVLPPGLNRGDTISTTSLLAGLDLPLGRQRIFGNAALRHGRFSDNSLLNNESYTVSAGLDWETINRLSGTVQAAASQSLARFNPDRDVPTVLRKNVERAESLDAKVRLGTVTRWTAEAGFNWRQVDYSADEFQFRQYEQAVASAGLRYSPSGALTLGAGLRYTDGKYPSFRRLAVGGFQSDQYKRKELDLTTVWIPSGASTLDARLSYSRLDHDLADQRDISGLTGLVRWRWKPTGKLTLNTTLSRDTGQETAVLNSGDVVLFSNDLSKTTTAARLNADYAVTAKIALGAGAFYARRTLVDTFTFGTGAAVPREGRDTNTNVTLNARWSPLRSLQLSCDVSRDRRSASGGLSDAYSVTIYGCSGQFLLQ